MFKILSQSLHWNYGGIGHYICVMEGRTEHVQFYTLNGFFILNSRSDTANYGLGYNLRHYSKSQTLRIRLLFPQICSNSNSNHLCCSWDLLKQYLCIFMIVNIWSTLAIFVIWFISFQFWWKNVEHLKIQTFKVLFAEVLYNFGEHWQWECRLSLGHLQPWLRGRWESSRLYRKRGHF